MAAKPLLVDDKFVDYTAQDIGDCNHPTEGTLQTNEYNGMRERF